MKLMEGRYFGRIWFPDQSPIEGVWLTIGERNMYVEMPASVFQDDSWPIVLGEFTGSGIGKVTFLKASMTGGIAGTGGSYRKLVFHHMLKGVHFSKHEDLMFKRIVLQSPSLLNWFGYYHELERSDDGKTFTIPEKKNVFEGKFGDFKLTFRLGYGYTSGNHETHIKHYCNAFIEFSESQNIDVFMKKMYLLKKFILFITHTDPTFSDIGLSREGDEYIKWVVQFPSVQESSFSANIHPHYLHLNKNIEPLLKLWFENEQLQDVIELMLEHYFNVRLPMPRYYQNMCVAIESFHTNLIQKKMPVSSLIVERRDYILNLLNDKPEIKEWFKDSSQFWLSPQFYDRLMTFKPKLTRIFKDIIDCEIDELINKIKQTRNEITHSGTPYKRFNGIELILVAKALEFTIKISIFEMVGILVDVQHDSLLDESHNTIRNLARMNSYFEDESRLKSKS